MKIAWIVWGDEDDIHPVLMWVEPDYCYRKVQIVYAEVLE